jgi:DNA-directed RNA polymerase alpha subunit
VEGVIYNNDAQPITWTDEGSEIQRLKKELDEQREWGNKMRDEYLQMMQERDELKERLAQLEPKPVADYANDRLVDKVYHEIDRLDIQEREENKKNCPDLGAYQKNGNAVRFMNVAKDHNIETVGQLLEVGSARFKQFRNMGSLCINRISEALDNLYGIKSW